MKYISIITVLLGMSSNALAFDLEDYATTYRATKDAYEKAQRDLTLTLNDLNQLKNYLAANCLKVVDTSNYQFPNLDGLISGTCNLDGEDAYVNGGVALKTQKVKIGDLMRGILERIPAEAVMTSPTGSRYNIVGAQRPYESTYEQMQQMNDAMSKGMQVINQASIKIVRIPSGCTKTNATADAVITEASTRNGSTLADEETNLFNNLSSLFKARRDAQLQAAKELKLATGPFFAARDAYHAATATYTNGIGCDGLVGFTSTMRLIRDPYVPEDINY